MVEAAVRFELTNNGFANRRLRPLGYAAVAKGVANYACCWRVSIAQSGAGRGRGDYQLTLPPKIALIPGWFRPDPWMR